MIQPYPGSRQGRSTKDKVLRTKQEGNGKVTSPISTFRLSCLLSPLSLQLCSSTPCTRTYRAVSCRTRCLPAALRLAQAGQPGMGHEQPPAHALHRLILADKPLLQERVQFQQPGLRHPFRDCRVPNYDCRITARKSSIANRQSPIPLRPASCSGPEPASAPLPYLRGQSPCRATDGLGQSARIGSLPPLGTDE